MTKLHIKNMVCNRCIMVVQATLTDIGLQPISVELGEVLIEGQIDQLKMQQLESVLSDLGFELMNDKKEQLIEKIKMLLINLVQEHNNDLKINLSDFLSQKLNQDYHTISKLFSEVEGITIEKYFIAQKIEKVKELLVYDERSLSEIAYQLQYSSVAHLSNQFKKVTGLTPTHFKNIKDVKRKPLDGV